MSESLYYLFLSGLILGSGPCLGFCAPILVSFIATYKPSLKKSLFSYLIFCAGRISGYMIVGALIGVFSGVLKSNIFSGYANIINMALGFFILFIGIITIISKDPLKSRYCAFLYKGNLRNAGVLGFLAGLSPCLPLLGILNYIIVISRTPLEGVSYAFVFGLGTAISPVIFLIGLSGKLAGALSLNQKIKQAIKVVSSLVLMLLGANIILKVFLS
ncbi:MAG: sulfite exporter TauE/SafE family protein [Candidatus Omnitrophota bacterium]